MTSFVVELYLVKVVKNSEGNTGISVNGCSFRVDPQDPVASLNIQ